MNNETLKTTFLPIIGFSDTNSEITLDADLVVASSGRYINNEDALLTLENLEAIKPATVTLSDWLREKIEGSILRAFSDWSTHKVLSGSGRTLLSSDLMIKSVGNDEVSRTDNGFISFETRDSQSMIYDVEISFHFTEAQTFNLLIFEEGQLTPIVQEIVYNTPNSIQWFTLETQLVGQKRYFLGYELSGKTYYNSVSNGGYYPIGRYYSSHGVYHDLGVNTLWDVDDHTITFDQDFGMNLRVTVQCDYTELVVRQKNLFVDIICKRAALDLLEELGANAHATVNRNESNVSRQMIDYKIRGTDGTNRGSATDYSMERKYTQAIKAVSFDETLIDPFCSPCKRGIIVTTI